MSAVTLQAVPTAEEAEAVGFRGSPTVLVDGVDPFADPAAPVGPGGAAVLPPTASRAPTDIIDA